MGRNRAGRGESVYLSVCGRYGADGGGRGRNEEYDGEIGGQILEMGVRGGRKDAVVFG